MTPDNYVCSIVSSYPDTVVRFFRKEEWDKVTSADIQVWHEHFGDYSFEEAPVVTDAPYEDMNGIQKLIEENGYEWQGCAGPEHIFEGLTETALIEMGFVIDHNIKILSLYENSIDAF